MEPTVTLEQAIREFRRMLPGSTNTARAIDHGAPWEQTAINAVNDGYIYDATGSSGTLKSTRMPQIDAPFAIHYRIALVGG
jgi:hypothetical protein